MAPWRQAFSRSRGRAPLALDRGALNWRGAPCSRSSTPSSLVHPTISLSQHLDIASPREQIGAPTEQAKQLKMWLTLLLLANTLLAGISEHRQQGRQRSTHGSDLNPVPADLCLPNLLGGIGEAWSAMQAVRANGMDTTTANRIAAKPSRSVYQASEAAAGDPPGAEPERSASGVCRQLPVLP